MSNAGNKKTFHEKSYETEEGQLHQGKYNLIDAFLNTLYDKFRRFELHREDAVARLIPQGEKLLDMGCGSGSFLFKVKDKFKELYGVDIASNRISEAKRIKEKICKEENIRFQVADFDMALPFEDGYFDVITSIATFAYTYNPYFSIQEMKRILKKGGILILEVPNIAWLPRRISLLLGFLPRVSNGAGWDGGHLHNFTVASLRDFLEAQGFKMICITGAGIFSNFRNFRVSLLSGDIIIKAEMK